MTFFTKILAYFRSIYYRWRFSAPVERPRELYVDESGVSWPRHPNYQDPDQPDEGQHDVWKKDLRIAIWRFQHSLYAPGSINLEPVGFGRRSEAVPHLFPLGEQLAAKCRTLGFLNLAKAAMPEATEYDLRKFQEANEQAVRDEAQARYMRGLRTQETWDPVKMGYSFEAPSVQETIQSLTTGPFVGATETAEPLTPVPLTEASHYSNYTREKKK